jgi:hypothetical protein
MQIETNKKLVNFRVSDRRLKPFDDACRLAGYTRTQALNEMMREFTSSAAAALPHETLEERQAVRALKKAVERLHGQNRTREPDQAKAAIRPRLKRRFADFLRDDPIVGHRS